MAPQEEERARRIDVQDMAARSAHEGGAQYATKSPVPLPQFLPGFRGTHQHRMARLSPESRPNRLDARPESQMRRMRKRHIREEDQNLTFDRPQGRKTSGETGGKA